MNPTNNIDGTVNVAVLVQHEIVTLPTYILQHYETPLVGMGMIILLVGAIFGVLKLLGKL